MAKWSFETTREGYANMWRTMRVTRAAECEAAARRIMASKARYQDVEAETGVPWFFIAILHMRESNNSFAGVLHNGEHIIGTGRKTRLVPAGRGPFGTWEEAAIDALHLKGLHKIKSWPVERIGYEAERFNGLGYIYRGVNSPYLWAGSNHYTRGKFVADGKFDPNHEDRQLGVMPVLFKLAEFDAGVAARLAGRPSADPPAQTPSLKKPPVRPPATVGGAAAGTVVAGGAAAGAAASAGLEPWAIAAIGVGVVALIGIGIVLYRIVKGTWPWTGVLLRVPSRPSRRNLAPSSVRELDQLSARLAALSGAKSAVSPEPRSRPHSASKPRQKP